MCQRTQDVIDTQDYIGMSIGRCLGRSTSTTVHRTSRYTWPFSTNIGIGRGRGVRTSVHRTSRYAWPYEYECTYKYR